MNGRVEWEPRVDDDGCEVRDCWNLAGHDDHVLVCNGDGTPGCAAVVGDEPSRSYRRRSTAKRWLLARASGLADVPKRRRPRAGWTFECHCRARLYSSKRDYRKAMRWAVRRGWVASARSRSTLKAERVREWWSLSCSEGCARAYAAQRQADAAELDAL